MTPGKKTNRSAPNGVGRFAFEKMTQKNQNLLRVPPCGPNSAIQKTEKGPAAKYIPWSRPVFFRKCLLADRQYAPFQLCIIHDIDTQNILQK